MDFVPPQACRSRFFESRGVGSIAQTVGCDAGPDCAAILTTSRIGGKKKGNFDMKLLIDDVLKGAPSGPGGALSTTEPASAGDTAASPAN
jgi:hypothetical protein